MLDNFISAHQQIKIGKTTPVNKIGKTTPVNYILDTDGETKIPVWHKKLSNGGEQFIIGDKKEDRIIATIDQNGKVTTNLTKIKKIAQEKFKNIELQFAKEMQEYQDLMNKKGEKIDKENIEKKKKEILSKLKPYKNATTYPEWENNFLQQRINIINNFVNNFYRKQNPLSFYAENFFINKNEPQLTFEAKQQQLYNMSMQIMNLKMEIRKQWSNFSFLYREMLECYKNRNIHKANACTAYMQEIAGITSKLEADCKNLNQQYNFFREQIRNELRQQKRHEINAMKIQKKNYILKQRGLYSGLERFMRQQYQQNMTPIQNNMMPITNIQQSYNSVVPRGSNGPGLRTMGPSM